MNPIKNFLNNRKVKNLTTDQLQKLQNDLVGWHTTGFNTLDFYKDNQYENGYGSIIKIVNTFSDVMPYTVDENGEKVSSNLHNRLYHPNGDMSSMDFREALAVMSLVHDRVFILVWRLEGGEAKPGGEITPDNLAGFTFLEDPIITLVDNKKIYTYRGATYTEDEVIELKDINPYNLHKGYSPAQAASKWATIDDYIAAYQTGFFKNGAVPAGQFIITAKTPEEFNDEVDKLEAKHKGAGKNNNIVYVHRPTDRDGKPSNAKIEWVPFNVTNKDLNMDALFEQANKKIDSVYGVPAEIRGILSNSNYASVNVAEKIFIKYVVKPFTKKVWTRFTHQLNRITGGLGVAISFELEVPGLVDEELITEQTKKHKDERVQLYLERGYTLISIKAYLDTDDLTMLEMANPIVEDDNADVDGGDEVEDSPDSADGTGDGRGVSNQVESELHCSKCDRFLGKTKKSKYEDKLKCSNTKCKALEVPIIKQGEAISTNPKAQENNSPESVEAELVPFEEQIEELLQNQIDIQVDRAVTSISDQVEEATDDENEELTEEILAILLAVNTLRGRETYDQALLDANNEGLDTSETSSYDAGLTEEDREWERGSVEGFNNDTASEVSEIIAAGIAVGLINSEIRRQLEDYKSGQGPRKNRYAKNESWRASELAGIRAMKQLNTELNIIQLVSTYKTWNIQVGACPICEPYADNTVRIDENFSGGIEAPPLHVNCRCILSYSITKQSD